MAISDNMRGAIYMGVAMATFTFNDTCMKAVTAEVPTFEASLIRGILVMVVLVLLSPLLGGLRLRFAPRDGRAIALRSVGEMLSTVLFLIALRHMPLANLSAIMQSLPLAVTLGAALFLREPIGWRRLTAIGVGFCGVLLIIRPGTEGFDHWSLFGVAAVLAVVVRDLSTKTLSREVPSVSVAFFASAAVTAISAVLAPIEGFRPLTLAQFGLIAAAGGFVIVGYMFVVMVMRVGEIGFVAPFRYTALIWAILLGWLVFGQFPDNYTLTGSAVVVATGIFTLYRERAKMRTGPAPLRIR